jgi:hypothetical protein
MTSAGSFWESYVEAWKEVLEPYTPYPTMTADKLACLNWQHLLYVSFVSLEAACQGELTASEENPDVLTCKEGALSLDPSVEGQKMWVATFGVEGSALGCPAIGNAFAQKQVEALQRMISEPDRKLLGILEEAIEDWIDGKLAPDWNIYLELAEMGELSEESSSLLEKIQRRLAVFRRKTIRSNLSNSKPSAGAVTGGAKATYIRNQTRRRRMANEPKQHNAPAVTSPQPEALPHVEEGSEC